MALILPKKERRFFFFLSVGVLAGLAVALLGVEGPAVAGAATGAGVEVLSVVAEAIPVVTTGAVCV